VGFDQGTQRDWLKKFSIDNLSEQLIVLIVTLITVIGLVVWWLSRQQKIKRSKLDQAIENLSKRLQKIGLNRQLNEPVLTWLQRIQLDNQANQRLLAQQQLDEIIQRYTQHQYIAKLSDAQLHELIQLLAKYTITPKS
jgi:flagellar basal body-associated protein FliL